MESNKKAYNVLFLCKGNSARSLMAESIMNRGGNGAFQAYSAGSKPRGEANANVLDLLERARFPVDVLRSKSWDEFTGPQAPQMDFVFTLCDDLIHEACPTWPGGPVTAHWGVRNPASFTGNEAEKSLQLADVFRILDTRIGLFMSLPFASLDRISLQKSVDEIGKKSDG